MATITRDNFTTNLKRSTNPRGSTPDGNIYFDTANDAIQVIDETELATVDFGGGAVTNPLNNLDKVDVLAIYFFALQEVELDPELQKFVAGIDAVGNRMGKLVGATAFLNSIKLAEGTVDISGVGGSLGDDRLKISNSGFTEFAIGAGGNTLTDRVSHGIKGVNNVESTSQAYYLLAASGSEADRQAATPVDFAQLGNPNQSVQTLGDTANGDTGAGNFDSLNDRLILNVRTFGNLHGETSNDAVGVTELGAYSQGYPLNESVNPLLDGIVEADVFGGSAVAPYDTMTFDIPTTDLTVTGFNEADGDFNKIIRNPNGATLNQLVAFADKLSEQDTDQNTNTANTGTFLPKRAEVLYDIVNGIVVWREGVFPENVPAADEQRTTFTAIGGGAKTRPFNSGVIIRLSAVWFNDPSNWFRLMYDDGSGAQDFNTTGAVTATDADATALAGDSADARIFSVNSGEYYELRFGYAYQSNTEAGLTADTVKSMVFQCGGTTTSKRRTISFDITKTAESRFDASTDAETN